MARLDPHSYADGSQPKVTFLSWTAEVDFEQQVLRAFDPLAEHKLEMAKAHPARFPSNQDSVGIELVGGLLAGEDVYETVTPQQNRTLRWLINGLSTLLEVSLNEVFRHPEISRKNPSEAETARW